MPCGATVAAPPRWLQAGFRAALTGTPELVTHQQQWLPWDMGWKPHQTANDQACLKPTSLSCHCTAMALEVTPAVWFPRWLPGTGHSPPTAKDMRAVCRGGFTVPSPAPLSLNRNRHRVQLYT